MTEAVVPEVVPIDYVQPKRHGKVPAVARGISGGKEIEGDFPLDQVVIDSTSQYGKLRHNPN